MLVSLGEGFTPSFATPRVGRDLDTDDLWLKDEGISPPARSRPVAAPSACPRPRNWACSPGHAHQRQRRCSLYDAYMLKEPYRIESKKTMGLELAEQFGWRLPDVILHPNGGGVGLIGIHKAFGELRET